MADEEETKEEVKQSTYERLKQRAGEAATQAKEYASEKAKQAGDYVADKAERSDEYATKKSEQAEKYVSNKLDQAEEYATKKAEQAKKYASENLTKERIIEEAKKIPDKTYKGMQRAEGVLDRNIAFDRLGEDTKYLWEQAKSSGRNIGLSEKQSARKYGDVQFPTLFGGSGGMFDTPERERKIRQPITKKYDPQTGKLLKREFAYVGWQQEEVAKNKRLVDLFESERFMTDYEKKEVEASRAKLNRLNERKNEQAGEKLKKGYGKIISKSKDELKKITGDIVVVETDITKTEKDINDYTNIINDKISTQTYKDEVKIKRATAQRKLSGYKTIKSTLEQKLAQDTPIIAKQILAFEELISDVPFVVNEANIKSKIVVKGHDPLSLFSKPKGSTSVSEEMKRLRGLQSRKPKVKKADYFFSVKTRDTFDLIGSPKQRREIPYATRPMNVSNPVSMIREPRNQLSNLTSQKIMDPFGGISVKKSKPTKAKKPIVINAFGTLTASKRKKEPPLKKLFGGGFDLAPIKMKKAKPLKAKKKKQNVNDAFNLFGKPKKGGLF